MSLVAAALLALAAAPTDAGTTVTAQDNASDPMVCQTQEEIGSRLKKKKICMRKSEWAAQRDQNKQMIERTQVQRGVAGGN